MKTADPSRILELVKALCLIPSVSGRAEEENRCADFIAAQFQSLAAQYPDRVKVWEPECEGDALRRKAVFALLRAPVRTQRTVILTGHFDVVDVENCGNNAPSAFDLERYTELMKSEGLSPEAEEDLRGGNWLFGRGSMDMKAGLSLFIASMEAWAADPSLKVNILFWAVPDEEANSAGMIGSLRSFLKICAEEDLRPATALTGEPCFWTNGSAKQPAVRPYYTGTTGKLMPFFYAFGQSAHINDYLQGFSSALLISEIVALAEADCALFEGEGLDLLAPPVCLGMEIRRSTYSVTVPDEASSYFNVVTAQKSPDAVLAWAIMTAAKASNQARLKLERAMLFAADKGADLHEIPEVNVMPFKLLVRQAKQKIGGDFDKERNTFYRSLPAGLDIREAALRECAWLFKKAGLPRPTIVCGFLPPYYPARVNKGQSEDEKKLRAVMEEIVSKARELSGDDAVRLHNVFGGISDLSFLGFEEMKAGANQVKENMAGWGEVFSLPLDLDGGVDIPVANMGPAGRDAHQATERLELRYSLEIAPRLLAETVEKLGE